MIGNTSLINIATLSATDFSLWYAKATRPMAKAILKIMKPHITVYDMREHKDMPYLSYIELSDVERLLHFLPFDLKLKKWETLFIDGRRREFIYPEGRIIFDLKPENPDEIKQINDFFYSQIFRNYFQNPKGVFYKYCLDQRKASFQKLCSKHDNFKNLEVLSTALTHVSYEFERDEFHSTVEKVFDLLLEEKEIDFSSQILTCGQLFLAVYANEAFEYTYYVNGILFEVSEILSDFRPQ